MKAIKWLSHNNFPLQKNTFSKNVTCESTDYQTYEKLKTWQPQQRILVDIVGFSRKLPPIYCKDIQKSISNNIRNKYKYMALGYLIPSIIFLFNFLIFDFALSAISWFLIFSLMSVLYINEYKYGYKTIKHIKERSLFFNWLFSSSITKASLSVCVSFVLLIGLIQLGFFYYFGNEDNSFFIYGVMYDRLSQGELWRLVTGPLLHYSFLHYVNNLLLLSMIGTLCLCLVGLKSVLVFISGNIIGAYLQYLFGAQELNNCGGISFGIYSLFGLIIGFNLFIQKILPRGFSFSLAIVALIGLIFSELLITNSATVGHFSGLFVGIVSNFFIWLRLSNGN